MNKSDRLSSNQHTAEKQSHCATDQKSTKKRLEDSKQLRDIIYDHELLLADEQDEEVDAMFLEQNLKDLPNLLNQQMSAVIEEESHTGPDTMMKSSLLKSIGGKK